MHTYMHLHTHTNIHLCPHACMHTLIYSLTYTYACTHIYTYKYTYTNMHMYVCTYVSTHTQQMWVTCSPAYKSGLATQHEPTLSSFLKVKCWVFHRDGAYMFILWPADPFHRALPEPGKAVISPEESKAIIIFPSCYLAESFFPKSLLVFLHCIKLS